MEIRVGKFVKIALFKYLLIFFCLGATLQNAISQTNLDSLSEVLPHLKGKGRLQALLDISYQYAFIDNEQYKNNHKS